MVLEVEGVFVVCNYYGVSINLWYIVWQGVLLGGGNLGFWVILQLDGLVYCNFELY